MPKALGSSRVLFRYENHLIEIEGSLYNDKTIVRPSYWIGLDFFNEDTCPSGHISLPWGHLIFIMGNPSQVKHLYIEGSPSQWAATYGVSGVYKPTVSLLSGWPQPLTDWPAPWPCYHIRSLRISCTQSSSKYPVCTHKQQPVSRGFFCRFPTTRGEGSGWLEASVAEPGGWPFLCHTA